MPSIKEPSTVEQIARVFCGEGKRNRGQTLRIVGYAESTCVSGKALDDVYGNLRVQAAIAKIDAIQAQIGHRTIAGLDEMYQNAHDVAETLKNPNAMATNITGIARLYNMDQAGSDDSAKPLTDAQRSAAMAAAKAATGPKLVKETG